MKLSNISDEAMQHLHAAKELILQCDGHHEAKFLQKMIDLISEYNNEVSEIEGY